MGQCVSSTNSKMDEDDTSDNSTELKHLKEKPEVEWIDGKKIFYDKEADKIIRGYIHFGENSSVLCNEHVPRDIVWLISTYHLRSITIATGTICRLVSGVKYNLDKLILQKWSILTVNEFDDNRMEGGILFLKVGTLRIEEGSSINLNGKGTGYKQSDQEYIVSNLRGANKLLYESHGLIVGNGYGTATGGKGGGCIYIECNTFQLEDGNILACGNKGTKRVTLLHSGHGGMIKITINNYTQINDAKSKIIAVGLSDRNDTNCFGKIEIKCNGGCKSQFDRLTTGNRVKWEKTTLSSYGQSEIRVSRTHNQIHPQPYFS